MAKDSNYIALPVLTRTSAVSSRFAGFLVVCACCAQRVGLHLSGRGDQLGSAARAPAAVALGFPKTLRGVPHVAWVAVAPEGTWHELYHRPHCRTCGACVRSPRSRAPHCLHHQQCRFIAQEWSHVVCHTFGSTHVSNRSCPSANPPPCGRVSALIVIRARACPAFLGFCRLVDATPLLH